MEVIMSIVMFEANVINNVIRPGRFGIVK